MTFLKRLFLFGCGSAALFLVAMIVLSGTKQLADLNIRSIALGYDVASVTHLLWMTAIVRRLDGPERRGATGWLYTAGFLHTLVALGVTITFAATSLSSGADTAQLLFTALAPMGAAIIPHFVGVAAGQYLETQGAVSGTRENSFLQQLAVDADTAQTSLKRLYSEREQALAAEIEALQKQSVRWTVLAGAIDGVLNNLEASANESRETFRLLSKETKSAIASVSQTSVTLTDRLNDTAGSAERMANAARSAASGAAQTSEGFRDAKKVVDDLNALHVSIVELLSNELFRK